MLRRTLLQSCLAALAAAVFVSAAGAAQAVRLARTPKKGDTVRYRFEVKGEVATATFLVTSRVRAEVTEAKDSGEFTTAESTEESKLVVGEMEQPSPPPIPVSITRARGNRVTAYKRESEMDIMTLEVRRLLASLAEPLLPEKAVSSGESWETELDNPAAAGKTFKVRTTFAGVEKIGDLETWKLTQKAAANVPDGLLSQESTFWLDPANGQIVKHEAAVRDVPSQFGAMSWKETQERVKP